ncbi:response regulator receiver domain protein [[Eubacterium] yurii subsp. margaretiae ATCC 43715]|nr:response regulator receiver domain protein [[Eubacterium] yurii subsp. margaretiae ATCC 43715]
MYMHSDAIKVMIVDDHELIREGISKILDMENDIDIIFKAKSGIEALEALKDVKPDVILLDINMSELNGIDTLKKIKASGSKTKIIMLTVYDDVEYISQSVNLGANGYVLKDSDSDTLIKTIKIVNEGGSYIQPTLATQLIKHMTNEKKNTNDKKLLELLTRRELIVMKEISSGLNNKSISKKLNISEKTVKNHVSSILKKLELQDRTQVAIYAIKNKIIDL